MRESWVALFALSVGCASEPLPPREVAEVVGEVEVEEAGHVEAHAAVDSPKRSAPVSEVRQEPPPGFVVLSEAVPGVVLDVRYATANNFTAAPLPGYVPGVLWVHRSTAAALVRAQASLAEAGYRLRVYDAYRPSRASVAMVDWAQASGRLDLLREGYVARRSNHARGNTVDVTLESMAGELLDMGTPWDSFSSKSHYTAARGEPRSHRKTLREAMLRVGFRPYAREWWHFTLPEPTGLPRLDVPYQSP